LQGVFPLSPSLDSVGPLANSVSCCAAMDSILAGEAPPERSSLRLSGLRLAIPTNMVLEGMDAPTERAIDRAVQHLDAAGVSIDRRHFDSLEQMMQAHLRGGFAVVESYTWHRDMLARDGARYDPRVASRILPGADMAAVDYIALVASRARIKRQFAAEMAPYDALMMPTVPIAPPPLSAFESDDAYRRINGLILRNPAVVNFLDGCAISLPCHENGAPPAGLMLVAPEMRDNFLFAVAEAVEAGLQAARG
jgi:aspartyl-tRNA(Asn)/glutamyl-tRNA(Gln) amidotransferase subunit A